MQSEASELTQYYTEALQDSRALQVLANDLLETLIHTQCELTEAHPNDSAPPPNTRVETLCTLENLILSLQNIQKDVAVNIENLTLPPRKTFFQSNIEQLTTIYQLLFILPSLHPFIPNRTSDGLSLDERMNRFVGEPQEQRGEREGSEKKREEAACFERKPRSMSSLLLARIGEVEMGMAGPAVSLWH